MTIYSKKSSKISGNNSEAKQYLVLNTTFRVYQFLKDNKGKSFCISKITEEVGSSNISQIRPKLLFLIKLDLIEKTKTQISSNVLYGYKEKWQRN